MSHLNTKSYNYCHSIIYLEIKSSYKVLPDLILKFSCFNFPRAENTSECRVSESVPQMWQSMLVTFMFMSKWLI